MKLFLETYGCQMNAYDSELVESLLAPEGYERTHALEEADIVLINTCAIREGAHRKTYGRLDLLRPLKLEKSHFIVGVLGCMAQNLKEALLEHPVVDLVVGPDNYRSLPSLVAKALSGKGPQIEAYLSEYETYSDVAPTRIKGVNGWIAVMRGCDNFCTFCVVPYTRGRERSRSPESIVQEATQLAKQGYPQVTLLGQNVNSYCHEGASFSNLILQVARIEGVRRVRFTSPHPKDFPESLLDVIADQPRICKHIHLPVQAGSNRTLDRMNRTYTREAYLDLVRTIRKRIPNVSLTTDMIVGFPGESEDDFLETVHLMEEAAFDNAFIFKYSERRGTIAAQKYPDDVPPDVKTDRIVRLFARQHEIALLKNKGQIGSTLEVLIEGTAEKKPNHQFGKSDGNATVLFPETGLPPGALLPVTITTATSGFLYGLGTS